MSSTNGHGPKRAILYARVSTDEQARSGYSLAQQLEALRDYAVHEGYKVLEEVSDPGQSGASLERPGMDRVRDLVAAGDVSVVLAQDRDRFAREPAYHYLLRREFEEYGTKIRALNDRGDDSPEGELTDGILDQLAKFERAKTAERTRRGKLQKARQGKVVAGPRPNFGFQYNAARDNYIVDEEQMRVMQRIFREVGAEGRTMYAVKAALDREGVAPPLKGKFWSLKYIRDRIHDDVYKPHSYSEVSALVSPEVAAQLDPSKNYGVWWFNRRRHETRHVAESGPDGERRYRRQSRVTEKPRSEWIAVPVPDSGIPRELVDAARDAQGQPAPSESQAPLLGACWRNHALRRMREGDVDQHRHEQEPPLLPLPDQAGQRQGSLRGHEPPGRPSGSRSLGVRAGDSLRPRPAAGRPGRDDRDETPGVPE
jgi:site-specific DNA recombinase